jgi:formylglycine-generating enzyme required for sulfatase activity
MIEIPAGEFTMGLSKVQVGMLSSRWQKEYFEQRPNGLGGITSHFYMSLPQMVVYLDTFKIDRLEVTQAQYAACIEAGGCPADRATYLEEKNHPVHVTFDVAQTYCQWLNKRLPTEAEWEKAARGTDGRLFPWGNEWETERVALDHSPVGSHPEDISSYGVLDMGGSADEYTLSPYEAYPGYPPNGPALHGFSSEIHVVRGYLRYSEFLWEGAITAKRSLSSTAGFRCVEGGEPVTVAEAMVTAEPLALPLPPTATTVDRRLIRMSSLNNLSIWINISSTAFR